MDFEIKLTGCLDEDLNSLKMFSHATDMYDAIKECQSSIKNRIEDCLDDCVEEEEVDFLRALSLELWQ